MFENIFLWLVLGVIAGILIDYIFPKEETTRLGGTISAALVGAFFGGSIYSVFSIGSVAIKLDPMASFVAIFGAALLVLGSRYYGRNKVIKD